MRRPAGVVVAAIVLGLMALLGVFGTLVTMIMQLLVPNLAVPQAPGVRAVMVVMTGLMLFFFVFCLWTVVGLFRMRSWARYSILAVGGLEFSFCLLLCATMILIRSMAPSMPQPPGAVPISYGAMFVGMGVFYGLLSLIGLWWLVYFNLRSVRAAFSGAAVEGASGQPAVQAEVFAGTVAPVQPPTPGWRVVIIVWASLSLLGCLFFPMVLLMHMPLFLFGMVFTGGAKAAMLGTILVVQIYLGVGLLKKWKSAWYVAMAWQAYTAAVFLSFLVPGVWSRFTAYQQTVMTQWSHPAIAVNGTEVAVMSPAVYMKPGMILGFVFGMGLVVVITMALLRRREDYLQG